MLRAKAFLWLGTFVLLFAALALREVSMTAFGIGLAVLLLWGLVLTQRHLRRKPVEDEPVEKPE